MNRSRTPTLRAALTGLALLGAALSSACGTASRQPDVARFCEAPFSQRLTLAIEEARDRLDDGCRNAYEPVFERLLAVGEGDPKAENKRLFSDYLLWASDEGYISPLQARETYTRYFGTKFVSALSDYNTCAAFCPTRAELLGEMRSELGDKSRGLVNVIGDRDGYGRASTLYQEMELVIAATCAACAAR